MLSRQMTPPKPARSFLREWISAPLRVASIAPSGSALSNIITSEIGATTGPVIELGPGTGVFTKALLDKGVAPANLALVEVSAAFTERLRRAFPEVNVYNQSAAEISLIDPFGGRPVGAIVSGLGLLAMRNELVVSIMAGSFHHLAPGAAFYQFTYGRRCPINPGILTDLGLTSELMGRTFRNLPPASVFKISKPRM